MGDKKKGFFSRLVEGLTKTRDSIVSGIDSVFSGFSAIDDDFYEEIEETLIMGDLGIQTTMAIVEDLRKKVKENHIKDPAECKDLLIASIKEQMDLGENAYEFENRKSVVLVIGVNGVGKTTSVGKLAGQLKDQGKKVILAAADTFRAAAIEQLTEWANRAGVEITLKKFLDMLLHAVLFGVMVFMAADQLGIKTTSFVAVIGTVTLAFSLAMQNTLSNFAGGTLILLLKPFKVGDYISTSSGEGTVESIGLVYTTLLTTDNRVITIPNSSVSSAPLTNLTRTGKRRLIINVGIGYSSDLLKAKNVLKKIFEENPGIMKDQPVQVVVDALGDSSVVLSARGWTTCEDYWTAKWSITEAIKLTFDKEGIEIPYQYMNVMMTKEP